MSWEMFLPHYERRKWFTKETSIAKCLKSILVDESESNRLEKMIRSCDCPKIKILWEILFDTGMEEVALLEDRIYHFGSMIKEQDYLAREIFLGMISLLKEIKKTNR
ncbi:MAG: hypothetical protein ACI4TK_17180 [Agathobacter sp.]